MCKTIDSLNHVIITENSITLLELKNIESTTPWYVCWFSNFSDHKFEGSININGTKHDNIYGTVRLDTDINSLSYDIFGQDFRAVVDYKTQASFIDGQNTLFSYDNLNFLVNL
jgi:hypothetical protein